MKITHETLAILLLLMPGFISSILLNVVLARKPADASSRVIEALVFSFLIYVLMSPLYQGTPVQLISTSSGTSASYRLMTSYVPLLGSLILSVLLPLGISLFIRKDLHMRILRILRITSHTARENTWQDVFLDKACYVVLNLKDGNRVFGWPEYYSKDPEEGLIYLQDPAWLEDDGTYRDMNASGILMVNREIIDSICFTHLKAANAKPRPGSSEPQGD
ncbi:MAG: hypothetical protein GY856_22605 [bacterium]|nr:hypothetical protein [bacterium]